MKRGRGRGICQARVHSSRERLSTIYEAERTATSIFIGNVHTFNAQLYEPFRFHRSIWPTPVQAQGPPGASLQSSSLASDPGSWRPVIAEACHVQLATNTRKVPRISPWTHLEPTGLKTTSLPTSITHVQCTRSNGDEFITQLLQFSSMPFIALRLRNFLYVMVMT